MATRPSTSSYPTWEYAFLKAIGAPQNPAQLEALNFWQASEGMPDAANNWLAFTAPVSNLNEWGTTGNSSKLRGAVGNGQWNVFDNGTLSVVTYPTMAAGISALVDFLTHGHQGIIDELRNPNATVTSIGDAITADGGWGNDGRKIIAKSKGQDWTIYTGAGSTGGGAAQSTGGFTQCDSSKAVIGSGGLIGFTLINECQAKALMAGFTIGVGLIIMNVGLLATMTAFALGSPTVRNGIETGLSFIPGGKAGSSIIDRLVGIGKAAKSRRTTVPTETVEPAEEEVETETKPEPEPSKLILPPFTSRSTKP